MFYDFAKRSLDLVCATLLLVVFSPIMITVCVLQKLTNPGPILVEKGNLHMQRMGKNGRIFRLLKFRSMMVSADRLERTDPRYKRVFIEKRTSGNWKSKKDPRITPLGKFIRKYSIDEMPQLVNVIKGEMSIVGPRPYLKEELEEQQRRFPGTERYVKEMLTVKPGITGYWQVTGRSDVLFDKRVVMDAYYARKKSLIFDVLIMLKTPWAMITAKGAM